VCVCVCARSSDTENYPPARRGGIGMNLPGGKEVESTDAQGRRRSSGGQVCVCVLCVCVCV
jgi:hypothetical protein